MGGPYFHMTPVFMIKQLTLCPSGAFMTRFCLRSARTKCYLMKNGNAYLTTEYLMAAGYVHRTLLQN